MGTLDDRVRSLQATAAHRRRLIAEKQATAADFPPLPERLGVLVKCTGPVDDLRAVGLVTGSVITHPRDGWSIVTGTIPLDQADDLAAIPHVIKVELGGALAPELDTSVAEIKARQLHTQSSPVTGKGVVVGVIDSELDYRHHSFRKSDGTSRLLFIWDQSLTATGTEASPPEHAGIGVEYNKKDHIDKALLEPNPLTVVRTTHDANDETKHGTHVMGIAAGDGSQAGNCSGAGRYVGVAPEANLIFVKLRAASVELGESQRLIDAITWIFARARKVNPLTPCVINISLGDNMGPHDGTSLVEQAIDTILILDDGLAVVKSAGNEGETERHAFATVPVGGNVGITFSVRANDTADRFMECWYEGPDRLDVTVIAPGVPAPTSPVVAPGGAPTNWIVNPAAPAAQQATVTITSALNDPDNNDNRIHLALRTPVGVNQPNGTWTVRFTNTGAAAAPIHCWLERGTRAPRFTSHVTITHTISIPGTAQMVITVGNYADEGYTYPDGSRTEAGALDPSSSRGPTRNGAQKPDLSAPGVNIISAKGAVSGGCCCDCCYDFYKGLTGTSMAAPHVTGVVALMLQSTPRLTIHEIRDGLMATARAPDPAQGTVPDSNWGAGMVDAASAVAVSAANHPGGGGGGGGGGGTGPIPYWSPPVTAAEAALAGRLERFQEWLLSFPAGHHYAALVSCHFDEVYGLINTNRRVAAAWHRNRGPVLVRMALAISDDPDRAGIPATIEGIPAAEIFDRILASWRRYASPALATDIDLHRETILGLPGRFVRDVDVPSHQVA